MPIVAGNQPQPEKKSAGSGCGVVIMLLVFLGRPLYSMIRGFTNGWLSDEQLLMVVAGIGGLVALAVLVQRTSRMRGDNSPRLPTPYSPPTTLASSMRDLRPSGEQHLPSAPRFEPIITGKVVLAGLILALVLGGIGLLVARLI